ncbi:MAG: ABC transporter permease [Rhodobacteraceae bacterium]|nr:ABC transporter permease [Paracoccaceae bacterium]PHR52503.1 MAG: peptide ABC transporter permease [Robiginitomaculum sp.]
MTTKITQRRGAQMLQKAAGFVRALASLALTVAITLIGLVALTFIIGHVVPIDPVLTVIGDKAPQEVYDRVYQEMGLDRPMIIQFLSYLGEVLRGNLGNSMVSGRSIGSDILRFFPATFELAILGIIIGVGLGIPAGIIAAVKRDTWVDHIVRIVALIGYSVPIFWLALMALLVFYARLEWVGGPGQIDIGYAYSFSRVTGFILIDTALSGSWDVFVNAISHIALPALLIGYYSMAYISRMTRSVMLEQLNSEYVLAARLKGASEYSIVVHHALRNAAIPLVTIVALSFGGLLEGSVLIETVFSWPGLGNYIAQSLLGGDINAVLGGTLVVGTIFVFLNVASDLVYKVLDPRTRALT